MPSFTTKYKLPYPVGIDPINVAGDIKKLADAVDAQLGVSGGGLLASVHGRSPDVRMAAAGTYDLLQVAANAYPFVTRVAITITVGNGNTDPTPNNWAYDVVQTSTQGVIAGHGGGLGAGVDKWAWASDVVAFNIPANTSDGVKVRMNTTTNQVSYGHANILLIQHAL